jgi:hypothetical protein
LLLGDLGRHRSSRDSVACVQGIYDKDGLVVKVNALASYGYLYVVAYLEA